MLLLVVGGCMELLLISSQDPETERWNWDIDETDGIALSVPEVAEEDQEANITAYLEKDTIPLMPERGIDWPKYLNKQVSLSEIDTQVRANLKTYLDTVLYTPVYSAVDGKLAVKMAKIVINTGA
jgi:hypothetical protein